MIVCTALADLFTTAQLPLGSPLVGGPNNWSVRLEALE
jgi:hypothetical protein